MAFQSSVYVQQGLGVPGERFLDSPLIAESFIINTSGNPARNIIGATCCTIVSEGNVTAGGTGIFAGFLADPKTIALNGVSGSPLSPTLTVPNYTQVECVTNGKLIVTLPAAANIGDDVIFNTTTGAISTQAPGGTIAAGYAFAFATVDVYTVTAAGLAVINIVQQNVIPANA